MKRIDETGVVHLADVHDDLSEWFCECGRTLPNGDPSPEATLVTCLLCLVQRENYPLTHLPYKINGRAVRDEYGYYTSLCSNALPYPWTKSLTSDQITEHTPLCPLCLRTRRS